MLRHPAEEKQRLLVEKHSRGVPLVRLVENRNGVIAAAMFTQADGFAELEAALLMLVEKQKDLKRRVLCYRLSKFRKQAHRSIRAKIDS